MPFYADQRRTEFELDGPRRAPPAPSRRRGGAVAPGRAANRPNPIRPSPTANGKLTTQPAMLTPHDTISQCRLKAAPLLDPAPLSHSILLIMRTNRPW